ncbi:transglycosylase SLT domain-containing protein [Priestia megaterium]|uniref:aggregation-promoting factor C-terminal-like domain-containing protein n=1 Tax=Priestia megaterium TaxID=1404 RepID=UPI00272FCF20|nr:transglycosylase SLT domain-containing protein [Priestia megaterium]MDP1441901.1 transglycosylase SLT domain-containing protein [Priestia megaterium]MDP1471034.1 transglycosylase SLT domain-containing protein [Priestia megaterium]
MSTVGQSNIQITADDQQARRTIGGFFRGMEAQGRRFTNRMQRFDPLIGVTNSVKNTRQTLAGLQDDFEGLGEGKTFQRITKSLNRVQNGLKTTGQVSQKSLKEMQKEIERVRSTLNELGDDQPFEEMREALAQTERQFESFQSTTRRFRFNQLENLPDHLKPFQRELNESRRQMRQMTQEGTKSLDDLADAAVKSSVGLERITSVTKSGKSAIKIIQDLGDSTKETQLAILGLNRNGTVKISTEETTQRLGQFKQELEDSKRKLEALRDAGDFGSYEAGMRVVEKKLADVNRAMYAASKGGQAYQRMINELGVNTSDAANQAAIAMEAYKDKFIRSVDLMNARSNQSKKMMDILPEVSHFQRIDKFFLGIGNRLENMGKQGTAANIAISMLGKNASMKDLNDRIMLINQGLMRMNQVALGLGVVLAGFTAAMFNAAKGPEVADVFEQRGQLLLDYQKAVEDRTQEIVDTWGLFEKAEVEKTKPETLMKNLQGQVDVMKNWSSNIDSLAKRGIDEGLLASLRKMGPEAAGQIQALTKMSDSELNKYVALWKEKHALARKEALTELEGLQKETSQKIKELENSLTPLGISLEKAKSTWLQALQPFIDIWGKIAAKVVDGATAIGEFVNKLNELNPSISASAGMFLYLFNAISLLLAPMAIGIGRAKGMQAAFGAAFIFIKPFVLGFLRIAGAATVLSSALVLVGGTFIKLWKNSENLRSAIMSLWDTLKEAGSTIAAPFIKAFQMISKEVTALLNKMVGSDAQNMASFWQSIGDKIAVGINKISSVIQPVAEKIASVVDAFVEWEGFLPVIAGLTAAFVTYKATVIGVAAAVKAWNLIQKASVATMALMRGAMIAYTVAGGGLQGILAVVTMAQNALNLSMMANPIGLIVAALVGLGVAFVVAYKKSDTFRAFVDKLFAAIKNGASTVLSFLQNNWPLLLAIITGPIGLAVYAVIKYWDQIKSATITAFNAVTGFFKQWGPLMLAALGGPLGLAVYAVVKHWDSIKSSTISIFNSVKDTVVNAFTKAKDIAVGIARNFVTNVKNDWNNLKNNTISIYNSVKDFIVAAFNWIKDNTTKIVQNYINNVKNNWNTLKSSTVTIYNEIKTFLSNLWTSLKDTAVKAAQALWNGVKSQWNALKDGTINIYNATKSFLTNLWSSLKDTISKYASATWNNVKSQWNALKDGTINIFNSVRKFLSDLWSGIKNTVTKLASSAKDGVVNAWTSLRNRTTDMFQNIKSKVMSIFDDIVSAAKKLPGRIGDGIKSMAGGVKKGVKSFANVLVKAMGSGLNGAIDGINWVLEKVDAPKIKKWPIPEYAKGTDGHPGGPAILGDGKKKEAYVTPDGRIGISPATDTLYNLPAGTRVFDGSQTAKMLKGVPMYAKGIGNKLKDLGVKAVDKGQELYEHAKDKTVKTASKAKDLALDVWDYMSDPEGLMKKVFGKFIPDLPKLGNAAGDMLKGGVKKVKDSSIGFIKDKLDGFMSFSGGGGDGSTIGPGSGYGGMHPYVEAWYRKVKDKFGPTRFMGAYNNRNVRGGSSKSMHAYGRAFDIGGSASTMAKIAEWARTHMNNLQYAIYNRRIAGPGMGKPWRHYSGQNPHYDHVHLDFFPGGGGGSGGSAPTGNLAQWIAAGMSRAGVSGDVWRNGLNWIIQKESTGNPRAVGAPTSDGTAKGLMQLKHFNYKGDPFNPVNNIYWGIKYIKDRYKSIGGALSWWRKHNWYAKGGVIDHDQIARVGEGGKKEVIIPLEQFKERAIQLLLYAGEKLGFDMTGLLNPQPQMAGASNLPGVQNTMNAVSMNREKIGSVFNINQDTDPGENIEIHNHFYVDGEEIAYKVEPTISQIQGQQGRNTLRSRGVKSHR